MFHDNAQFVKQWMRVGPLLEQVRRAEIRQMRHEDQANLIDELLAAGLPQEPPATTSGLVEMQRIFSRAKQ